MPSITGRSGRVKRQKPCNSKPSSYTTKRALRTDIVSQFDTAPSIMSDDFPLHPVTSRPLAARRSWRWRRSTRQVMALPPPPAHTPATTSHITTPKASAATPATSGQDATPVQSGISTPNPNASFPPSRCTSATPAPHGSAQTAAPGRRLSPTSLPGQLIPKPAESASASTASAVFPGQVNAVAGPSDHKLAREAQARKRKWDAQGYAQDEQEYMEARSTE